MNSKISVSFASKILFAIATFTALLPCRFAAAQATDIQFADCASQTLRVILNIDGKTSKAELVSVWSILGRYPLFKVTVLKSASDSPEFTLSLDDSCKSSTCAQAMGWTQIQTELSPISGISLSCDKLAGTNEGGDDSDKDGGVGIGN